VIRPVRKPPGQSLSDFRILRLIAEAWGCGGMFESWQTPEAVFTLLGKLSAGRPCDISGITGYEQIDREGGIQWPSSEPAACSVASEPGRSRPNEIRNLGNLVPMHQLPSSKVPPTAAIAATMQQPSTLSSSAAPTHPPTLAAGPSQQQPQQQLLPHQPHQPHRK
jgi:hypothetical protein